MPEQQLWWTEGSSRPEEGQRSVVRVDLEASCHPFHWVHLVHSESLMLVVWVLAVHNYHLLISKSIPTFHIWCLWVKPPAAAPEGHFLSSLNYLPVKENMCKLLIFPTIPSAEFNYRLLHKDKYQRVFLLMFKSITFKKC